jgi:NAD(P)-dependent dehydrogenase (short-subunit alcohol dehydrogenase family)
MDGRTALVTGASKGIGKGIALELARAGCDVAINYRSDVQGAAATVAEIAALRRRPFAVYADIGLSADVNRMFDKVLGRFDRLDILVNNACAQTFRALVELEEAEWDRIIATNLKGCFLCTQCAARHMIERGGGGRIVNIGSGSNRMPFPKLVNYTASKGGIEMFTKVAALELGPAGVTVNCVAPGAIEIERTRDEAGDYAGTWARLTPLGRIGTPADIAYAVVFLAGDRAGFITGQTLYVDGGLFTRSQWPYE